MIEKTYFFKLLLEDHFEFCREDCEFKKYSKMPLTELIEKTLKMSSVEIKNVILKHQECLQDYHENFLEMTELLQARV